MGYTMYIQVMTFEEAENWKFNPFDLTKVWPHGEFPLIEVGKLKFNRNPRNYFAEVEQLAFSPAHLVPGIEPSPDKMLQGRLFSYSDTNPTLMRFFSLHFMLPFLIAGISMVHLLFLHQTGRRNPLGLNRNFDKISFHPYFSLKDP